MWNEAAKAAHVPSLLQVPLPHPPPNLLQDSFFTVRMDRSET